MIGISPFATVNRIRGQDDDYWNNHRTTPKAFVSLNLGKKLWGSRFEITRPSEYL